MCSGAWQGGQRAAPANFRADARFPGRARLPVTRTRAASALALLLFAIALAAALACLALARGSDFGFYPAAGTMATLADAVLRGQAPGHHDGTTFLRTFYFPPYPLIVAAAKRMGLEWAEALRAASALSAALLLVSVGWLARALGGSRFSAALAAALALSAFPIKSGLIDGRADLLAAALAIAGLAAWSRDDSARGWRAPALAAAAFLTRAASLALPVAFALWALSRRDGRALARFFLRFAICLAAGVLITLPVHGPLWYRDALRALFTHGAQRSNLLRGPGELVRYLGTFGELALVAALGLAWLARRDVRARPVAMFMAVSIGLTALVIMNYASGPNHLAELAAGLAACAAVWSFERMRRGARLPALAVAIAVCGASWRDLNSAFRNAPAADNRREAVIRAVREEPGETLTEDALIALAAGKRPAVSDMDALRAMARIGDRDALATVAALARRRYALVVLNDDLANSERWYASIGFHDATIATIRAGYHDAGTLDGYHLYRRNAP